VRRALIITPLSLILLALAGCGQRPAGPISLTPAEYDPLTRALTPLADGADVHLQIPPQGGAVLFIGAEATNLSDGSIQLDAKLTVDGALVGEDRRVANWVKTGGHFAPPLDSYVAMPNVPVCPAGGLVAVDRPARLKLELSDGDRRGSVEIGVTARCAQTEPTVEALCVCECAADFMPGHCP
jgi:predicted small lipoprotein YifL